MDPDIKSLQSCLEGITDPRKKRGVRFPLVPMLLVTLVGLLARQISLQAIVDHAALHWAVLGAGLGFSPAFGVPHATTLARLLAKVAPEELQAAFGKWLAQLVAEVVEVAAVDGKYPHQSRGEAGEALGVLNVFAHELKACLWQWVVSEKEAEPSVLKAHLDELFARYPLLRILTGDALFAQRGLCEALVKARRGYLLRVKGNQPELRAALQVTFEEISQRPRMRRRWTKPAARLKSGAYGWIPKRPSMLRVNSTSPVRSKSPAWTSSSTT
jgi:hypothetical protein